MENNLSEIIKTKGRFCVALDFNDTKEILNWVPPISVEEGIRRMVQGK